MIADYFKDYLKAKRSWFVKRKLRFYRFAYRIWFEIKFLTFEFIHSVFIYVDSKLKKYLTAIRPRFEAYMTKNKIKKKKKKTISIKNNKKNRKGLFNESFD